MASVATAPLPSVNPTQVNHQLLDPIHNISKYPTMPSNETAAQGANGNANTASTNISNLHDTNSTKTNKTTKNNNSNNTPNEKYHSLIIDSGAIIKQTAFTTNLHTSACRFYTVPAVIDEIRDPKSRQHLEDFKLRLQMLNGGTGGNGGSSAGELQLRAPSQQAIKMISDFARKTGDYDQLSSVDLQVLALLWDLEYEANGCDMARMGHVRREPKRVLGVDVRPMNGKGEKKEEKEPKEDDSVVSGMTTEASKMHDNNASGVSFFQGDGNGMIDPSNVEIEYDDDEEDEERDDDVEVEEASRNEGSTSLASTEPEKCVQSAQVTAPKVKSWAMLVNPNAASSAIAPLSSPVAAPAAAPAGAPISSQMDVEVTNAKFPQCKEKNDPPSGQFDGALEKGVDEEDHMEESEGEEEAMNIAEAESDDEMSDEECDVFILEPHEAVYFKKLKEEKLKRDQQTQVEIIEKMGQQSLSSGERAMETFNDDGGGLGSEFPSLAAAAEVPYEGSSDEEDSEELGEGGEGLKSTNDESEEKELTWQEEEEERKKKSLQPMINGKLVNSKTSKSQNMPPTYNSFLKYGNVISASGSAHSLKKKASQSGQSGHSSSTSQNESNGVSIDFDTNNVDNLENKATDSNNVAYKSRILGSAGVSTSGAHASSAMTEEDDDGEGWVVCTRDIQTMKASGSLHISSSSWRNPSGGRIGSVSTERAPDRMNSVNHGPPISQRAACATTDFAMQNVILQMNLELLTVDGVRVRRLKTWVTRCAGCFTIYGGDGNTKVKSRLFCDKCGSSTLQRIAASVDRETGRLKLHMKKNYQYNTRGMKYSLPKPGKGNKYEGDLLLSEDQLMYGAWAQKVKKGKPKSGSQSIFGSDLASDLGCHVDLTKRDDIKVGFGKRNPNSSKFGRERRGKKKKNKKDKACGLRRY